MSCVRPTTMTGSRLPPSGKSGHQLHGLNGDILVWNSCHLSGGMSCHLDGCRVNAQSR